MSGIERPGRHQRSATGPLLAAFVGLVVYASLYPFSGWEASPLDVAAMLALPWPTHFDLFDIVSNLLGYWPLGFLAFFTAAGWLPQGPAAVVAVVAPSLLSYSMELTQFFLPGRVPSLLDALLNTAGALLGASCGAALLSSGAIERWQRARDRWLAERSSGAIALLLLWPLGLLFPPPVPFGMGPPWDRLLDAIEGVTTGVPWLAPLSEALGERASPTELDPVSGWLAIVLGLLAPTLLAFTIARPGWRRVAMAAGAIGCGCFVTTLSTALNFGPLHALAWFTRAAGFAIAAAIAASALLAPAGRRLSGAIALLTVSSLVALVMRAPTDPYFAESLQAWEQGRFIRFHGLAQWVGWLWPLAAIGWLLRRIGAEGRRGSPASRR